MVYLCRIIGISLLLLVLMATVQGTRDTTLFVLSIFAIPFSLYGFSRRRCPYCQNWHYARDNFCPHCEGDLRKR
jgi:hypothetical protein